MSNLFLTLLWVQVWQIAVVAGIVWLLTRWFGRTRSRLSYALWLLVVVKCVTPPLWGHDFALLSHVQGVFDSLLDQSGDNHAFSEQTPTIASNVVTSDLAGESGDSVNLALLSQGQPVHTSEVLIDSELTPLEIVSSGDRSPSTDWTWLGYGVLVGMLLSLLVVWLRYIHCLRRIRRHQVSDFDETLSQLVQRLCTRLNMRRMPHVIVSDVDLGPAVLGILRHIIVLPKCLLDQERNADALTPVMAHELLHIRRGDLTIGTLQALVQCLWWFHPVVWFVNRFLSRETERCCDEEVLTEIDCSPADYARSLLAVIESRQPLKAVPVFPGMKPVEITTQRMERIMSLKNGSQKRMPMLHWLAVFAVAMTVLPGAALSDGSKNGESDEASKATESEQTSPTHVAKGVPEGDESPAQTDSPKPKEVEQRIQDVLEERVSLHFENVELVEVGKHLAETIGINIAFDRSVIEQNGMPTSQRITIDVENISLRNALKLLLKNAGNLTFEVEDDLLKIRKARPAPARQPALSPQIVDRQVKYSTAVSEEAAAEVKGLLKTLVDSPKQKVNAGTSRIETLLRQHGYFDAAVFTTQVEVLPPLSGDESRLSVVYAVDAGKAYQVRHIRIEGAPSRAQKKLDPEFQLQTGKTFSGKALLQDVDSVDRFMSDHGFFFTTVIPQLDFTREKHEVNVTFRIEPGKRPVTGNIRSPSDNDILVDTAMKPASNRERARHVAKALTSIGLIGYDIEIQVKDELATLLGTVRNESQIRAAKKATQSVPGISKVDCRLKLIADVSDSAGVRFPPASFPDVLNNIEVQNVTVTNGPVITVSPRMIVREEDEEELILGFEERPSPAAPREARLEVRVYNVADLVIVEHPVDEDSAAMPEVSNALAAKKATPKFSKTAVSKSASEQKSIQQTSAERSPVTRSADADFTPLVELIRTSVEPESWGKGKALIHTNENTLSLVVRQTAEAHEKIGELLGALRQEHELMISCKCTVLLLPREKKIDLAALGVRLNSGASGANWALMHTPRTPDVSAAILEAGGKVIFRPQIAAIPDQAVKMKFSMAGRSDTDVDSALGITAHPLRNGDLMRLNYDVSLPILSGSVVGQSLLKSGQTLILECSSAHDVGVPVIGDVPHVGRIFRNAGRDRALLLITPVIVRPEP